ncbi:hypothetical protein K402DRAFT_459704 [Aulographum hederae CBS 113979]|uniref:GRIP domain-containing protein n=1 Tax=Aulographum hederae CBS 113979 TaxID=1176131 RepID=A0A6G1HDB8_9PEZI|nr:hypothetical protein K402DRAFT_459704 [Aulographum hederae CBS 113979]
MTSPNPDSVPAQGTPAKSKKKNKKKKGAGNKGDTQGDATATNGEKKVPSIDTEDIDGEDEDTGSPIVGEIVLLQQPLDLTRIQKTPIDGPGPEEAPADLPQAESPADAETPRPQSNGTHAPAASPPQDAPPIPDSQIQARPSDTSDTDERLEALAQERNTLRDEVTELRKSLEEIQSKHEEDLSDLRQELDESQSNKVQAETQYRTLLGKVNTIKATLGERLKSDAEELSQARTQIEELEDQDRQTRELNNSLKVELAKIKQEYEQQGLEVTSLRGRASLSQQNWIKERDELITREAYAREEFETAKQAMQDWEVLALEERSLRENMSERVAELEDQIASHRENFERAASERDTQAATVDGLQRALQDIQDARKRELRELVENSQSQLDDLRKQLQKAEEASTSSQSALETTRKELERAMPFEKEVKEKNLLIGKLRHEAVILNDHLTKALRFLKQRKPEDMVDRQLVTNHFLHFVALDRSDPKKFQVLQLIAALLSWTEDQKEQAGLARPGANASSSSSAANLRVPLSPFRRSGSTPSLNHSHTDQSLESSTSKESLAELWSEFLEREAREGMTGGSGSRSGGVSVRGSVSGIGSNRRMSGVSSPVLERKSSAGFSPVLERTGSMGSGSTGVVAAGERERRESEASSAR